MVDLFKELENIAKTDIFEIKTDDKAFVGNPFKIDYDNFKLILILNEYNRKRITYNS